MAATQPPDGGTAVERALDVHDFNHAATEFDALEARRLPPNGTTAPDPLLDRLFARYLSARGSPALAMPLLERVLANRSLGGDRANYLIALAAAQEQSGDWTQAATSYSEVAADTSASPAIRVGGAIGLARVKMVDDPAAALAALHTAPDAPETRWEVALQQARIAALAGQKDVFDAAIAQAWAAAPLADVNQAAPARIAIDIAAAAMRTGNRKQLVAMLAVDRVNRLATTGQDLLSSDLPQCGIGGVQPDDTVVVQYVRESPLGRPRAFLIWASRRSIAKPFMRAVAAAPGLTINDGQATGVVLRCRTAPSADYAIAPTIDEQIIAYSSAYGAYPLLEDDLDASSLAAALADRERRYGADSVMLLPILLRLISPDRPTSVDQDGRKRLAAVAHRVETIIAANRGPANLLLLAKLMATGFDIGAQVITLETGQARIRGLFTEAFANSAVSADTSYSLVAGNSDLRQTSVMFQGEMLEQAIAAFKTRVGKDDPRTKALVLRLIEVRHKQRDMIEAGALAKTFGFAPDLCALADPPVKLVAAQITAEDYPPDLVEALLRGRSMLEMDVGPSGMVSSPRVLVSDPLYVFDEVALRKTDALTYEGVVMNGKPAKCHALVQGITWQLPD